MGKDMVGYDRHLPAEWPKLMSLLYMHFSDWLESKLTNKQCSTENFTTWYENFIYILIHKLNLI